VGGVLLHRGISNYLAAAGGLLLFAVVFVWIAPEISALWGWPRTILFVAGVTLLLALADAALIRLGHSPRHGVVAPLLAATAIHSLLDGWSIRALASQPLPAAVVPIGLGLHKIPEGFALGWVLRRSLDKLAPRSTKVGHASWLAADVRSAYPSPHRVSVSASISPGWSAAVSTHARVIGLGALAEIFTLVGAFLQPATDRFGLARFGALWTPAVLCVIAGAFVFLGVHALLPYFRHEHD
jgi:zinc transporter ZupT